MAIDVQAAAAAHVRAYDMGGSLNSLCWSGMAQKFAASSAEVVFDGDIPAHCVMMLQVSSAPAPYLTEVCCATLQNLHSTPSQSPSDLWLLCWFQATWDPLGDRILSSQDSARAFPAKLRREDIEVRVRCNIAVLSGRGGVIKRSATAVSWCGRIADVLRCCAWQAHGVCSRKFLFCATKSLAHDSLHSRCWRSCRTAPPSRSRCRR